MLAADVEFGFLDRSTASQQILHPQLIHNAGENTMLRAIKAELAKSKRFIFSVAFVTPGALALLKQDLLDFKGRGTLITSTYLGFNSPDAFRELLTIPTLDVYVIDSPAAAFHAKGYVFEHDHEVTAIIGSSNLTRQALLLNTEWNLRFSAMPDGDIVQQLATATQRQADVGVKLTAEWIAEYAATWETQLPPAPREAGSTEIVPTGRITPNAMQSEALEALRLVQNAGEPRALIVSATGTGKTILAALAAREITPHRMLFLAHREQILEKARSEFARVFETSAESLGILAGGKAELDKDHVFATVQSLSRPTVMGQLAPNTFDLIIIDEVHRSGGETYRRIIDHFCPSFLLGLTATPERSDNFNIYELFNHTVPYEIRLKRALESEMLAPFNYYGVADFVTASGETISDASQLSRLVDTERVDHIITNLERYGHANSVKGLIFCSRNEEASELSDLLNQRNVHGHRLRTVAISGATPINERDAQVAELEAGNLDYILTVDIFNEGIDIPAVNQVVMLRRTQSSIVFTQQLGRGLRKALGKDHLRVIDFIGNYDSNFLIPIALFGDSSLNKDVIRKRLIEAQQAGAIAGVSSINFEEVARDRIFDSLAKAKLDSVANFKRAIAELEQRLGKIPRLYDFARFDTVDPVVIANHLRTYWDLLSTAKKVSDRPNPTERGYLTFLSSELLNGKRPQELLVLRQLLASPPGISKNQIQALFTTSGCDVTAATLRSTIDILTYTFATQAEVAKFGPEPVATESGGTVKLSSSFSQAITANPTFASHVEDVIETGLYLARHHYNWGQALTVGERYSRKDVCRLLNWRSNQQSVMYGYKVDVVTNTCPIFITYHKDEEVAESTAYEDEFLDHGAMRWFTKSRRTLESDEVRAILRSDNAPELHVFVKKDDAESAEFYYLGRAHPREAQQTTMPSKGTRLSVVTMKLELASPVETALYDYLTRTTQGRDERTGDSYGLGRECERLG